MNEFELGQDLDEVWPAFGRDAAAGGTEGGQEADAFGTGPGRYEAPIGPGDDLFGDADLDWMPEGELPGEADAGGAPEEGEVKQLLGLLEDVLGAVGEGGGARPSGAGRVRPREAVEAGERRVRPARPRRVVVPGGVARRRRPSRRWGEAARRAAIEAMADGKSQALPSLRAVRESFPLSQRELAERTGLSKETISAVERGAQRPLPRTMRVIARVLGVEAGENCVALTIGIFMFVKTRIGKAQDKNPGISDHVKALSKRL